MGKSRRDSNEDEELTPQCIICGALVTPRRSIDFCEICLDNRVNGPDFFCGYTNRVYCNMIHRGSTNVGGV